MSETKCATIFQGSGLVVQYDVEIRHFDTYSFYIIFDDEDKKIDYEDDLDYMLDDTCYILNGHFPDGQYVEGECEANSTCELVDKQFDQGDLVADMRGDRLVRSPVFIKVT